MNNRLNVSEEEWQNRIDLAACYHLADHFGWSDIIWNHITSKTSKNKNSFLINKFGLRYDEITASNLLEIDLEGNIISGIGKINYTGFIIHGAIHNTKKNIHCVMHTHSRAGLAISCLKKGLDPIIQDAAIFHNRVSYHDWEGMSTNREECDRLTNDLSNNKVMILRNHGLLTCGESISEAFILMYYLERACKNQLDTYSMGLELNKPSSNLLEFASGQFDDPMYKIGNNEWPALKRILDDKKSIYNK